MKKLLILALLSSPALVAEEVHLMTKDEKVVEVDENVARLSSVVKKALDETGDYSEINLFSEDLEPIFHAVKKASDLKLSRGDSTSDALNNADKLGLRAFDNAKLSKLLDKAIYLELSPSIGDALINALGAQIVANSVRDLGKKGQELKLSPGVTFSDYRQNAQKLGLEDFTDLNILFGMLNQADNLNNKPLVDGLLYRISEIKFTPAQRDMFVNKNLIDNPDLKNMFIEFYEGKNQQSLSNNSLKKLIDSGLTVSSKLSKDSDNNSILNLSNLGIDSLVGLKDVPKKQNINILDLSRNNISNLWGMLSGFNNLNELDLKSNRISQIPAGVFQQLSGIQVVDLSYNQIKDISDFALKGVENIMINLKNNPLSDDVKNRLIRLGQANNIIFEF